ncbi:MAG: glucose-6-phosphate isomerase family protein [Methanoregula sp.]
MKYGWEGELPVPGIRTVNDMRTVLADPGCQKDAPLYYMYRDLALSGEDRRILAAHRLRYDMTVIPSFDLCGEFVKTKGHYHPQDPAGTGYPELYEVIDGEAQFLLQSHDLADIVLVSAGAGDCVIIPPGYGHVSINPSKSRVLVMANIVSTVFESEYREYEMLHGAAYYVLTDGKRVKNPYYPDVPEIRVVEESQKPITGPIYPLIHRPEMLRFLNEPEKYADIFTGLLEG